MARKQALTNDNILTDVKNVIKRPANLSRTEHYRSLIPYYVFITLMIVAMFIFEHHYKLVLLFSLAFILLYFVIDFIRKKNSIKKISFDGYEVNEEVVSCVKEERYITDHSVSRVREKLSEIHVFVVYFESGKTWNIPKDNYTWSKEFPMSDRAIYQTARQGSLFWTVTKKTTGEIVMAYPSEYFEYKN